MPVYDDWASSFSTSVKAVVDEQTKFQAMQKAAAEPIPYEPPKKVTVKPGDTLSAIAKANNMTLAEIRAINPTIMNNPQALIPAQILLLTHPLIHPLIQALILVLILVLIHQVELQITTQADQSIQ